MIHIKQRSKGPDVDKEVDIVEALLLMRMLVNGTGHAHIVGIGAKRVAFELISIAGYPSFSELIFSGEGPEFERVVWMARDACIFAYEMHEEDLRTWPFKRPPDEPFDLFARPFPAVAKDPSFFPYGINGAGTVALVVQLGIVEVAGINRIQFLPIKEQKALLERMLRAPDPLLVAREAGVPV